MYYTPKNGAVAKKNWSDIVVPASRVDPLVGHF